MSKKTAAGKPYAIMRFAKISSFTVLARVCQHNTRAISGENIRKDAPPPVELLENGSDDFVASAHALMEELAIDKDSCSGKVLAVEAVTTASGGWFDNASDQDKRQWLAANVEWAKQKFGRGLLAAKLHLDEEVWHIHFVAVPVVEKAAMPRGARPRDPEKLAAYERRRAEAVRKWTLSYHDVLGGKRERFGEEQDRYHDAVKHLGLERGETQRDDTEIDLGDELTVSAVMLARGKTADGTPRPRRSLRPAEYRKLIKRLHKEAEALKRYAEEAVEKSKIDVAAANAVRTAADEAAAEAISQAKHSAALLEEAYRAMESASISRAAVEAQQKGVEEQRRQLEAERELLSAATMQAERMRHEASELQRRAEAEANSAREAARAAEHERAELFSARSAIARDRAELIAERERQRAEIDLLARGADDSNGLELKPKGSAFSMSTERMTRDEYAIYTGTWTTSAKRIGHHLALALQRIRQLAADVLGRERRVKARETELAVREAAAAELAQRQAANAAEFDRRRAAIDQRHTEALRRLDERQKEAEKREVALVKRERETGQQLSAAEARRAELDRRDADQQAWLAVITGASDGTLVGSFREEEGYFRLRKDAKAPADIARTIVNRPPPWAANLLRMIDKMFRDRAEAAERILQLDQDVDDLHAAIARARSLLPAERQEEVNSAATEHRSIAGRANRIAAMRVKEQGR